MGQIESGNNRLREEGKGEQRKQRMGLGRIGKDGIGKDGKGRDENEVGGRAEEDGERGVLYMHQSRRSEI